MPVGQKRKRNSDIRLIGGSGGNNSTNNNNKSNGWFNMEPNYPNNTTATTASNRQKQSRIKRGEMISMSLTGGKLLRHQKDYLKSVDKIVDNKTSTDLRGMLINHTTGSGKTTSILGTILKYLKTGRRIYIITTVNNKKSNTPAIYAKNLKKHFPEVIGSVVFGKPNAISGLTNTVTPGQMEERFKSMGVNFFSFENLASHFGLLKGSTKKSAGFEASIKKDGAVFIVDEAHELIQPSGTRPRELEGIRKIREKLEAYTKIKTTGGKSAMHLYLFSGTPGDSIADWNTLLSFVRPLGTPKHFADIRKDVVGNGHLIANNSLNTLHKYHLIHRGDISSNTEKVGKISHEKIMIESPDIQFGLMAAVLGYYDRSTKNNNITKKHKSQITNTRKDTFLQKYKQMQNYLTMADVKKTLSDIDGKSKFKKGFEKSFIRYLDQHGLIFTKNIPTGPKKTSDFFITPKLVKIADKIHETRGKQLVYSEDRNTLYIIKYLLSKYAKYGDISSKIIDNSDHVPTNNGGDRMVFGFTASTASRASRIMNLPGNKNGELVRVIGVTAGSFQGLDIKGLRGVHIVDQFASEKRHRQLKGRIGRAYALHNLNQANRMASTYQYITVPIQTAWKQTAWQEFFVRAYTGLISSMSASINKDLSSIGGYMQTGIQILVELMGDDHVLTPSGQLIQTTPGLNAIIRKHRVTQNIKNINRVVAKLQTRANRRTA